MIQWPSIQIIRDDGSVANAIAPMIISASRATDIPAFYNDWFFKRLSIGYSAWINPFNGTKSFVSFRNTRFIIFWSKNPAPLLEHITDLDKKNIGCYIQYSLNDYEREGLEKAVPPLTQRLDTFKRLSDSLGKGRVIWRFDPLVLTDNITEDSLLEKIEHIGDQLYGYTEKLVFSFADILAYKKVKANLERDRVNYQDWTDDRMDKFASRLSKLNGKWGYNLGTCAEKIDLEKYGISHNKCIDEDLLIRFAPDDKKLMDFLGVNVRFPDKGLFGKEQIPEGSLKLGDGRIAFKSRNNKDKGQRPFCGCIASKDIGEYNACTHLCEYCYANANKEIAINNYKLHKENPYTETITGKI